MNVQTITEADLDAMTTAQLAVLHNKLAKPARMPLVKRFATKGTAIRRTWALVELAQERAAKAQPKPTTAKAPPQPATAQGKQIKAGTTPATKSPICHVLHAIATQAGSIDREQLIARTLAEYTPPRSATYNREFVLGYIAYGLRDGFLAGA